MYINKLKFSSVCPELNKNEMEFGEMKEVRIHKNMTFSYYRTAVPQKYFLFNIIY